MLNAKDLKDLEMLVEGSEERAKRFEEVVSQQKIIDGNNWTKMALIKYRLEMLKQRKDMVTLLELKAAFEKKDYSSLKDKLSKLFLEYINDSEFDLLIKQLDKGKVKLEDIHSKHLIHPEYRLLRVI